MADCLLSLSQAAAVMGVSNATARKLAKAEILPFNKLGGRWVIPRSALYDELGLADPNDGQQVASTIK